MKSTRGKWPYATRYRPVPKPELNRERQYVADKQSWLTSHPHATPAEISAAMRLIARRHGL